MAPLWRQILENLEERLDEDLLPALYASVSLPGDEIRAELHERGLAFHDPITDATPSLAELDLSADQLISTSVKKAGLLSAAGAMAGAIGVPPEVLATLVHSLRLAQRLSVIYGFDPETDRGRMLLWRAVGAAHGVEVPDQGSLDLKMKDLPTTLTKQMPRGQHAAAWVTRQVVGRTVSSMTGRVSRLVPGIGMGLSAWRSTRRQGNQGKRMKEVFRGAWEGVPLDIANAVEAEEVG